MKKRITIGMRLLPIFLAAITSGVVSPPPSGGAGGIYISQSGSGSGTSCVDSLPASFVNNSSNWGSGTTQIGPGKSIHLCGSISTSLTAQASGSSGSPITFYFESGAKLSQAFCPSTGCLNISNRSYIIVDGGGSGIIESTANGTGRANQQLSHGIDGHPCNNCEIKNITLQNFYVHSSPADEGFDEVQMTCILMSGSNWLVHDNTMHDAGWCINDFYDNGDTNVRVYRNNIYNVNHGFAAAGYPAVSASNFYFYENHVHDYANWDTNGGGYHHDGVHGYGDVGANLTNLQIYNNLFDGNTGANFTSHIYLEQPTQPSAAPSLTNWLVFNNVLDGSNSIGSFGVLGISGTVGGQAYNNTIFGANVNGDYCFLTNGSNAIFMNNIVSGCWAGIFQYHASPAVVLNNNVYANSGACGVAYDFSANCYGTLAGWQAYSGQDAASQKVANANLDGSYKPIAGSPVIGAGAILSGLGISALNSDKAGILRPTNSAWTVGAYSFGSSSVPVRPAAPTGVTVIVN